MKLRPLTPEERNQAGVSAGLVVEESSGRAAEAGIQEGRRGAVGQRHAGQQRGAAAELVHRHGDQVALLIQRGDTRIFVPVGLG